MGERTVDLGVRGVEAFVVGGLDAGFYGVKEIDQEVNGKGCKSADLSMWVSGQWRDGGMDGDVR